MPVRRVYISKANGKERPLGIPTMHDRALQTLVKAALEPEWEARFENNSYGFRPGRSCQDARKAIFNAIRYQPKYVLDADISKCFDCINHAKLLEKANTFPKARKQIKAWLKAGILDRGKTIFPEKGSPQGGVISPLLANIALHGMELRIKEFAATNKGSKKENKSSLSLIRYADDFLILHKNLNVIKICRGIIEEWLKDVGLELNKEKTKTVHTLEKHEENPPGFDFLGFNIRQYPVGKYQSAKNTNGKILGFKTITKPSKESVKKHYRELAKVIDKHKASPQWLLVKNLKPKITGWCNYYKGVCSKETFSKIDNLMYWKLMRWEYRRHSNKSKSWAKNKYWHTIGGDKWRFAYKHQDVLIPLPKHSDTKITRHIKVKGDVSPYNGDWVYWGQKTASYPGIPASKARLLKKQKGKCNHCRLTFKPEDKIETDHVIPIEAGGSDKIDNLQVIHKHCHDVKTKTDLWAIKRYKIRKKWNKVYAKFQKQFDNSDWIWDKDIPTLV